MSFKADGPRTRPSRVKPPPEPPADTELPWGWTGNAGATTTPSRARSTSTTSTSSNTSFHSAASKHDSSSAEKPARFTPDEEAAMIATSNAIKTTANAQFAASDYSSAIGTYDKALTELPSYLDYELAVLQSNIAACHLRLEQWKEALEACDGGLKGLDREWPMKRPNDKNKNSNQQSRQRHPSSQPSVPENEESNNNKIIELDSTATDAELAETLQTLNLSDARKANIKRIRIKLLLRRARARSSLHPATWSHLAGALDDYTVLASPEYLTELPKSDQTTVRKALIDLPPKVNEAKDKEVGEMMGKLKDLGNGILKPFGLSTDMFKMVQDPSSGGWSMSFDQGGGGGGQKNKTGTKESAASVSEDADDD